MLSESNKKKLCMTGIYTHKPEAKYRGSIFSDDLYHCCNWTFTVCQWNDGIIFMKDTYWSDDMSLKIELTDENIEEFILLFNCDDVTSHSGNDIYDYDESDWWRIAIDSSGRSCGGKYFLKKGAVKNREKVLKRLEEEIVSLEHKLEHKKQIYEEVKSGKRDLQYA